MQKQISGCHGPFAELPLGLVLEKARLGVQLGPFFVKVI